MKKPAHFAASFAILWIFISYFTPVRAQQRPIALGLIAPLTGPFAAVGKEVVDGAKLAVDEMNGTGGNQNGPVILFSEDDQGRPEFAVSAARKLRDRDKVVAFVGLPSGGSALAVRNVANDYDLLMISLSSVPLLTSTQYQNVLRLMGKEDRLASTVADFIRATFPKKKVGAWLAQIAPAFSVSFQAAAHSREIDLTRVEATAAPDTASPTWITDVDVLAISPGVPPDKAQKLISENRKAAVIASILARDQELALLQAGENVHLVANPSADFFSEAKGVVARARTEKINTGGYFIYGYASIQIAVSLLKNDPGRSGRALGTDARGKEIPTALGRIKFDEAGDPVNWRFSVLEKFGSTYNSIDVCKRSDCKDYEQCPKDCPTK
jgi:branched-chain amino acid transport system substrate-binding protein